MATGILTLIPTPITQELPLEIKALELLHSLDPDRDIIVVEELKMARRRWISWGLERSYIEKFEQLNEHNQGSDSAAFVNLLQQGKNLYLLSDCGLPAFCDPGQKLVELCHRSGIKVTSTPFPNSVILAMALSGFPHNQFSFEGFLPRVPDERKTALRKALNYETPVILMDTPYRLKKTLEELKQALSKTSQEHREIFLAMDLNRPEEELIRGSADFIGKKYKGEKREFILIIGPK